MRLMLAPLSLRMPWMTRALGTLLFCCLAASGSVAVRGAENDRPSDAQRREHFETKIAPLLAKHCLECHDTGTASTAGELDLSRKDKALAGGESGPALVAGKSAESLIWQYVESDEMPKDRAPLSDNEKDLLRKWIDSGATWSVEKLDAEAFRNNTQGTTVWLQRLTIQEYINTVRGTVGVDIAAEAHRLLPRDQRADGFTNTAYNLGIDLSHIEAYSRLAKVIVDRMDVPRFVARHADCNKLDDACMRKVVERVGKRLFRGPVREEEITAFLAIATKVKASGGDFDEAASFIIQGMLQSPRFIFRLEQQRGDGSARPVDDYELASRMSYILWGGPPDERLMKLADEGKLNDNARMQAEIERMLRDPQAIDRSLQFVSEWLDLDRLRSLQPNPSRFPQWNAQLAEDMRIETQKFFEDLVWQQDRPLWELMDAQFTYATPRLAYHYGLFKDSQRKAPDAAIPRITQGLKALYDFREGAGEVVRNVSGAEELNLRIADPAGVRWQPQGLDIHGSTLISTERPATSLAKDLKKSKAISLEAWVTPLDTVQAGPARILTLSNGIGARNFTLGQNGDSFEVRLRTKETSANGQPELTSQSGTVVTAPTHVVYTRDASGNAKIYIDGQESDRKTIKGDFSNWDERFHLALGNELSKDRLWQGTLHLAAIYDRALSLEEVRQNNAAGAGLVEDQLTPHIVSAAWERSDKQDLLALYRFDEGNGDRVRNQANSAANSGQSLDLKVENTEAVKWSAAGLTVYDSTLIATPEPAKPLIEALKKSQAYSVEAWVTPANSSQNGPARVVSLSSGSSQRNFTLGQDGDKYDLRLRGGKTDNNGLPSLSSPSGTVTPTLTHLVFTCDERGQAKLYVDGQELAAAEVGTPRDKWDSQFRLMIANETTKDRPWLGTYHLVAVYGRALRPDEIQGRGAGIQRYDLTENPARGGLLTQGSILTIGGDHASMVTRGLFVLHDVLDSRVGNPPASVDTTPIPTKAGLSMRDTAELRLADSSCAGCHTRFEPLAFGLEKFDGIGAYHEIDHHGNKLREDGEILFPGSDNPAKFENSAELMRLLAGSERVRLVITRKLLQFSLGRPLNAADMEQVPTIHAEATKNGGTYRAVMTAILNSDLIRKTRTEIE